jgi:hypothetical protein
LSVGLEVLAVEPLAHFGSRALALDEAEAGVQPVAAGSALLRGKYLHLLPVVERGIQRNDRAVDFGAAAPMPELGMDVIGEIDRRRTFGQVDHAALRREHINGVRE